MIVFSMSSAEKYFRNEFCKEIQRSPGDDAKRATNSTLSVGYEIILGVVRRFGDNLGPIARIYAGAESKSELLLEKYPFVSTSSRSHMPGRPTGDRSLYWATLARFWFLKNKEREKPKRDRHEQEVLAQEALTDVGAWFRPLNITPGRLINLASDRDGRGLGFLLGVPGKHLKDADIEAVLLSNALANALEEFAGVQLQLL